MNSLGFEKYVEPLRLYLSKYREVGSPRIGLFVGRIGYGGRAGRTRFESDVLLHATCSGDSPSSRSGSVGSRFLCVATVHDGLGSGYE